MTQYVEREQILRSNVFIHYPGHMIKSDPFMTLSYITRHCENTSYLTPVYCVLHKLDLVVLGLQTTGSNSCVNASVKCILHSCDQYSQTLPYTCWGRVIFKERCCYKQYQYITYVLLQMQMPNVYYIYHWWAEGTSSHWHQAINKCVRTLNQNGTLYSSLLCRRVNVMTSRATWISVTCLTACKH